MRRTKSHGLRWIIGLGLVGIAYLISSNKNLITAAASYLYRNPPCLNDFFKPPSKTPAAQSYVPTQDLDRDGDVDLADYELFKECLTGPENKYKRPCDEADFDEDNYVDLRDFAEFQRSYTGPEQ